MFVKKVVKRDKFKTGQDEYVEKQILSKKTQDIPIGRIPVMVKSVLCNTTEKEKGKNGESYRKGECAFDQGGYFVIKGAEKVSYTKYMHFCCHGVVSELFLCMALWLPGWILRSSLHLFALTVSTADNALLLSFVL